MLLAFSDKLNQVIPGFCLVGLICLYKDNIHVPSGDGVRLQILKRSGNQQK